MHSFGWYHRMTPCFGLFHPFVGEFYAEFGVGDSKGDLYENPGGNLCPHSDVRINGW